MLEYGIKTITTNPTLITKADEIIRLVDTRSHKTRAFVLPVSYEPLVERLAKEMEFRKWVNEKKEKMTGVTNDGLDDLMLAGIESIEKYMQEDR